MLGNRDDNCIKQEREGEGRGSLTASLNGMVDGMARTPQARKALWAVAFVLVIAALVFGIRLTYSAFSANDHLKAVAVTGTSQSLFASDVLAPYSTAPDSPAAKALWSIRAAKHALSPSACITACLTTGMCSTTRKSSTRWT